MTTSNGETSGLTTSPTSGDNTLPNWSVSLHVYDLTNGMAAMLSQQFLGFRIEGIWHTGIVVYGKEYYFGGGIQNDPPSRTPYGRPVKILPLGTTEVPPEIFEDLIDGLRPRFNMGTYDILNNNCNNFTNEVALFLVGKTIPEEITSLPSNLMSTPLGQMFAPMIQSMQQQVLQMHNQQQGPPPGTGGW